MNRVVQRIHSHLGEFHDAVGLGARSHEAAICRHVAASFFTQRVPAFACIAYPDSARLKDGVTRDECDLVIRVSPSDWLWIEVKQIWKPDGAGHWLWVDAISDVKKLSALRRPEAAYVALLLIGLDKTVRVQHCLRADIEGRFIKSAGLSGWQLSSRPFKDRDGRCVNAWLWWRKVMPL